ncbi:MAG TPA: hypothetical protein VIA18_26875 [Polyangia bacterium]|jgi:hypothetical protein|nr:hypothetical protein [Polyangia bacterium]
MKRKSALWFVVSMLAAGCGGSTTTQCESVACENGSYQVCATSGSKLEYKYGGKSCTCGNDVQSSQCESCLSDVEAYCGVNGDAGGGGSAGGGGGSINNSACMATFLGGFSGSVSACDVTLTQTSASGWTVTSAGGSIAGTSESWTGFSMLLDGTPGLGTYEASSSAQTSTGAFSGTAHWTAGFAAGTTTGDVELDLTALGAGVTIPGSSGTVYPEAHGVITGTLVDSTGANPDLYLSVSF